jgi:CHAD domain-containing protein
MVDSELRQINAKYIRRQVKQLVGQLEGVRAGEESEFVHRARVATRRLRAALRMADQDYPRRRLEHWLAIIRRLTRRLGEARDRDVQIEMLCGALAAVNTCACFPGIARILVQLERQREQMQRKVVKAVDCPETNRVLRDMRRAAKRLLQAEAAPMPKETDEEPDGTRLGNDQQQSVGAEVFADPADVQPLNASARLGRHLRRQIDELLDHQASLGDPSDRHQHHAMRIAAKRLRYTLEITKPVYPRRLEEAVSATKKVQSLLGEVHDCDVWLEDLDQFTDKERHRLTALFGHAGRLARLLPGIDYLREDRRRQRENAFQQLLEYWSELKARAFWEGLAEMLDPTVLPCEEPRLLQDA